MRNIIKILTLSLILTIGIFNIGSYTKNDIDSAKKIIESYLKSYDDITLKGEEKEIDDILSEDIRSYTQKKAYICKKRLDEFSLHVDKYSHIYEYSSEEINKDFIEINLKLTKEYKYNFLRDKTVEIIHYTFKIIKEEDKYIIKDIISDEIYDVAIKNEGLSRNIDINIDEFIKNEEESIKRDKFNLKEDNEEGKEEDFYRSTSIKKFNRDKMKSYAKKHYDNPSINFYDFTTIGGDCTNFVSQIMKAGGAPFDNLGKEKWYYHSLQSRTPSWTSVEALYNYLMNNKEGGIIAEESTIEELDIGDIIQLDTNSDNIFNHSVVIVEKIINTSEIENLEEIKEFIDGGPLILIAARTYNSYNRPLLTYPGNKRYIRLVGYRE